MLGGVSRVDFLVRVVASVFLSCLGMSARSDYVAEREELSYLNSIHNICVQ